MRQVVLDTETTGLEPAQGHRIIEIGCVELIDRKLTGRTYHQYINPQREIDDGAIEVHGITNEFLADKPTFVDIVGEFLDFIKGSELVIHNAAFDIGFMDHEFSLTGKNLGTTTEYCTVLDTLLLARKKHPGQKNNLDALCRRYEINNSHRDLHGALLDAEILADVYLMMTGGQTTLSLTGVGEESGSEGSEKVRRYVAKGRPLRVVKADQAELASHQERLDAINRTSEGRCVWLADKH